MEHLGSNQPCFPLYPHVVDEYPYFFTVRKIYKSNISSFDPKAGSIERGLGFGYGEYHAFPVDGHVFIAEA
jgi:hypothetical protein